MNIAENILKYHLRNVYFFCGTACGGKTTISKALAEKHGFLWVDGDVGSEEYKLIADTEHQPAMMKMPGFKRDMDWEEYFDRPFREYHKLLEASGKEQRPMTLLELIKLADTQKVVVDTHMPIKLMKSLTDYNRVVFLVTDTDRIVRDYLNRPGHQEIYDLIMTLQEPERKLENLYQMLRYGNELFLDELYESDVLYISRDDNSTVADTLAQVERHFGLKS
ncbi:MAG: ATP-binding protein [Oscillospiraceae bacterium]|jgi:cytidylate kinase|nr:ATP-binding protein [Oscillospiraceae bacterium]